MMSGDGPPAAKRPKDEEQYSVVDGRTMKDDFFLKKSDLLDFCLVVEGKQLWVPKQSLALCSPFFRELCFNDNFQEGKEGEAVLKGKTFVDVLCLLEVLIPHPHTKKIGAAMVPALLRLAFEWQIECVIVQCWECLLASKMNTYVAFELLQIFSPQPLKEIPVKVLQHVLDSAVQVPHEKDLDGEVKSLSSNLAILLYRALAKRLRTKLMTTSERCRCFCLRDACKCTMDLQQLFG